MTKEVRAYPGAQQITALAEKEEACQKKRWKEGEEERMRERLGGRAHFC